MRLNLGCGDDVKWGWENLDIDDSEPGVSHIDLEDTPWFWDDDTASEILMDNVLEHIHPRRRTDVIEECARVLDDGARLTVRTPVPEIGSGWDLTHYTVPSWRWPLHPRWRDTFDVVAIYGSCVGPGKLMPERFARALTRFWIARCVDEVTVVVEA